MPRHRGAIQRRQLGTGDEIAVDAELARAGDIVAKRRRIQNELDVACERNESAGAGNLVGNPGFESALAGTQQGPAAAVGTSFGNWLGYTQDNNHSPPSIVAAPVHAGAGAGHVLSTGSAQGGNGQFFVQDFQSFAPNQGYALDVWVYPVAAQTQAVLLFGWDRNAGSVSGSAGVTHSGNTAKRVTHHIRK